jgi:multimeric flavodoxin WrbA
MLKILAIHGSPHKGQTCEAAMEFLKELGNKTDIETRHVYLFQQRLEFCRGCGTCVTHGEDGCPHKDGFREVHAAIRDADAVIVTTPVYALQVTALVKNFIDRSSYVMHRPCYFGKWFMSVSTQYFTGDKEVEKYLADVMRFWGFNVMPGLRITMTQKRDEVRKRIGAAVTRFQAIERRARFPVPTWKDLMMFRFRRSAMGSKRFADVFPRDVGYFREKGWLEAPYYYDVRLDPLKRAAGLVFDAVGRAMMGSGNRQDATRSAIR